MRFSFSLFQFVDVQVEKAAFSISSVTVITLQIVHFIFLLVNTSLQNLPFFCFDVFSCGKNQIVEVFLRLFCTAPKLVAYLLCNLCKCMQLIMIGIKVYNPCRQTSPLLTIVNYQLSNCDRSLSLATHPSVACLLFSLALFAKSKSTMSNLDKRDKTKYTFDAYSQLSFRNQSRLHNILFSSISLPGIYQDNITTF